MIRWIKQLCKEIDCVLIHGEHVYNDGPWRPSFRCFWCNKLMPGKKSEP